MEGDFLRQLSEEEKVLMNRLREVYRMEQCASIPSLKSHDRRRVNREVDLVNGLIHNLACEFRSVTDVNRAEWAGAYVVCERLGLLKGKKGKKEEKGKPWWQRRVEGNIERWRSDLAKIEESRRKRWKPTDREWKRMDLQYRLTDRGALGVIAFLKSKI